MSTAQLHINININMHLLYECKMRWQGMGEVVCVSSRKQVCAFCVCSAMHLQIDGVNQERRHRPTGKQRNKISARCWQSDQGCAQILIINAALLVLVGYNRMDGWRSAT